MGELQIERSQTVLSCHSSMSDVATGSLNDHSNALGLDDSVLPPPPPPFPMEQLAQLLAATQAQSAEDDLSDIVSEAATDASDTTVSVEYDYDDMTEINLVGIQRHCVGCMEILVPANSRSVSDADHELAAKLGDLLEATYELETFHPSSACCSPATPSEGSDQSPFLALVHTLLGAQAVVAQRASPSLSADETSENQSQNGTIEIMREELAWARVETLARDIVQLVRDRNTMPTASRDESDKASLGDISLPPRYRRSERDSAGSGSSRVSGPPSYMDYKDDRVVGKTASPASSKMDRKSAASILNSPRSTRSRIAPVLNDLDTVTHAIERLNTMAPRLHDQRVALRTPSQRRSMPTLLSTPEQRTEARLRELDDLWNKIEHAHSGPKQLPLVCRHSVDHPSEKRISNKSFMFGELPPTPASAPTWSRSPSKAASRTTSRSVSRTRDSPPSRSVSRTRTSAADDEKDDTTLFEELMQYSASSRMQNQEVELRPRSRPKPATTEHMHQAIKLAPGRLACQDFPIPLDQFLARKKCMNFDARSVKSATSKLTTPNLKPTKHKHRPKDLLDLVADASSTRFSNQEVPPPTPRGRKTFLEALSKGPKTVTPTEPRTPVSAANSTWLPRNASRDLLTSNTPTTPTSPFTSPWGRAPSTACTPTSPSFPPSNFGDEPPRSARRKETSIRKIMGSLVRRASSSSLVMMEKDKDVTPNTTPKGKRLPLPPMPPLAIDHEAVGYLCEHQENLRAVQVMLYGGDTSLASDLELEVATPCEAVVISRSDPKVRISIVLPTPVPLGQRVPFNMADGHIEAKLCALPTPSSALSLNPTVTHALSAPHLRNLAARSLCCTHCDREVAEFPSDVQFKDLPSEHWAEMLEVWMCHADPAFTAHIAKQTKDGFWPTRNTVLVGGSYLLVAGSDVCKDKLVEEETSDADDWRLVTCPCGEVLGKSRPSGLAGAGTVRFSKWAISLIRGRGGVEIEHVRYPVSCFVVSDMLELSQAHASYRFLIEDEASGTQRLALWLFNPSMHVAYRRPATATFSLTSTSTSTPTRLRSSGDRARLKADHTLARSLRGAKIMFKLLDGADRGTAGLPGFGGQVETLRYPADVCDNLIAALRNSTTVYPAARRSLGAFSAGFLERV